MDPMGYKSLSTIPNNGPHGDPSGPSASSRRFIRCPTESKSCTAGSAKKSILVRQWRSASELERLNGLKAGRSVKGTSWGPKMGHDGDG